MMRPFGTRSLSDRLILALGFISRLPMPGRVFAAHPDARLADSADMFALAGLVIALPACGVLALFSLVLPHDLAAVLALITLALVTGALHEDGLADSADAFFGGQSVERRLEIMKDSRIGTYGALALIFQFIVIWSALSHITQSAGTFGGIAALCATAMLSRAGLVWHWHVLPFARPGGLAESQGRPDWESVVRVALWAGLGGGLLLALAFGPMAAALALAAAMAGALVAMVLARAKIGGQTGDTLGLTQKMGEVFVYIALAAALA